MARVMVDSNKQCTVNAWGYVNREGHTELVTLATSTVEFRYEDDNDQLSSIYYEDLPNFIKALQAAYDSKQSQGSLQGEKI